MWSFLLELRSLASVRKQSGWSSRRKRQTVDTRQTPVGAYLCHFVSVRYETFLNSPWRDLANTGIGSQRHLQFMGQKHTRECSSE
jgi:hypothetical protein